jgi:carboxymethylenebutenolidase
MQKILKLIFAVLAFNTLASAQSYSVERLENSPRHHEWVEIKLNGKILHAFVVYPEKSTATQAVIVIHENRGLNDWARSAADQFAEKGYLAIAPDYLSDFSAEYKKTSNFANQDDARTAIYELKPEDVTAMSDAAFNFIRQDKACNGQVSVAGFCWGGLQSFNYSIHNAELHKALVFYGSAPTEEEKVKKIACPVYGFYGENDARINAGIPGIQELMTKHGKFFEPVIYPGAGHAFMKSGDDPEGSAVNKEARNAAWERIVNVLE